MKKVEVTWIDAWSDEAIVEADALVNLTPVERLNRGLLVTEDKNNIVITQGIIKNLFRGKTLVDGFQVIPKGMITKMNVEGEA